MGMFDWSVDKKEFEEFREEISQTIEALSKAISEKATDSEATAKIAATNAVAIEAQIKATEANVAEAIQKLTTYKDQALTELNLIKAEQEKASAANKALLSSIQQSQELHSKLLNLQAEADAAALGINSNLEKAKTTLTESQSFPEEVKKTKALLDEAANINADLETLLKHSMKRKSEIDELYKQIYGHDVKDSAGSIEHIDGIKDLLETSYDNLEDRAATLNSSVQALTTEITEKHKTQLDRQLENFETLLSVSSKKIESIEEEIKGLLPGAMATGLSAAYETKKEEETAALKKFETTFKQSIGGLITVSLIPFAVDIYLLAWQNKEIIQLIKDTPSLIISILPLYFPVLWLAYSTNKKINLSKRLIEEYTHKSVLGKTFSGLSGQIDKLPQDDSIKEDLRTRLLFNVMQVSAENPGKLITNYNKSDHPLMEALENSSKLSDSVESLAKIPGLSALAQKLTEKSDEFLRTQQQKIEKGFSIQATLESSEEAKP